MTWWKKVIAATALVAAILPRAVSATPQTAQPGAAAIATATTAPADTPLDILQKVDTPQESRDNAARILAAGKPDDILPTFLAILKSGDPHAQTAVARAIASEQWASPQFVDPLVGLLATPDVNRFAAAVDALAQYKTDPNVHNHLLASASAGSEPTRVAAIHALAGFDQKDVVQQLVALQSGNNSGAIQDAAGDALMDMTGQRDFGHDAQRWQKWFGSLANLNPNAFRAAIEKLQVDHHDQEVRQEQQLRQSTANLLNYLYLNAPANQRADILLHYLGDIAPEIRIIGAEIVYQSLQGLTRPAPEVFAKVREMLSDSSPRVRAAAARALFGNADSGPVMTARLKIETDDDVRIQLIRSLAPLHSNAAVQTMLDLMNNPSTAMRVRVEATLGIGAGAGDLFAGDPSGFGQEIENALKRNLQDSNAPNQLPLRQASAAALANIRDQSLLDIYNRLLQPNEPVPIRVSALQGEGNLRSGDVNLAIINRNLLSDQNRDIRLRATAVGSVPQPLLINQIVDRMKVDPDAEVRSALWGDLESWLPSLQDLDLSNLADDVRPIDPQKELQVRQALRDKLSQEIQGNDPQKQAHAKNLALQQQTIGDLLMAQQQPESAITQYQAALDFWTANQGPPETMVFLIADVTRAMLAARHWDDAAKFASQILQKYDQDPNMATARESVSNEFKAAADNLQKSDRPTVAADAKALLEAAKGINPPLVQSSLENIASEVKQILDGHPGGQ